ncbi:MAG: amino acid-binding protein [Planctomycetaceae bacterium]|nr:amino acid-binding protein [Planctomycetaceae bacterium]
MTFDLMLLPGAFTICRLDADAQIPGWANGEFVSITRTPEELSIVCRQDDVPDDAQSERGWRCLRIVGKLEFSLVGVIATLTKVLADAGISVFLMSTYDTDYFLVRELDVDRTVETMVEAGHSVQNQ